MILTVTASWPYGRSMPTDATRTPEIAVVGAGPAGIAAAFRLQQAGYRVRVFEAESRVGGDRALDADALFGHADSSMARGGDGSRVRARPTAQR